MMMVGRVSWNQDAKADGVGSSWRPLKPPAKKLNGDDWSCNGDLVSPLMRSIVIVSDCQSTCSLHVHSVTTPHNYGRVFSSTAPGYVMAVGSVGDTLAAYGQLSVTIA
jgi:hypothetical protein